MSVLPISKPSIKTYQYFAFPLAILECHEETKPWIYSNFIQLSHMSKEAVLYFKFIINDFWHGFRSDPMIYPEFFPQLEAQRFSKKIAYETFDILSYIKKNIDNEYYTYIFLDKYYVPNTPMHNRKHFIHDVLINGYDDDEQVLYISAYNHRFDYKNWTITYDEFNTALKASLEFKRECYDVIQFFRYNKEYKYELDKTIIYEYIHDYLNCTPSDRHFKMFINERNDRKFGISIYDAMFTYFDLLDSKEASKDIRQLSIITEHKVLMTKRLKHLYETNVLKTDYSVQYKEQVEHYIDKNRFVFLKYEVTDNKEMLDRVRDNMMTARKNEIDILNKVLEELK